MKLPPWNGVTSPRIYVFNLGCFILGYLVIRLLSLGRIQYDDREGPGFNPVTRMPDGSIGLSEFAITSIGFVLMGVGIAILLGLTFLWITFRPH